VTVLPHNSLSGLMKTIQFASRASGNAAAPTTKRLDDVIRVAAESLDYICVERLTPGLVATMQLLVKHGELMVLDQKYNADPE
jgi:hypothetical protein